MRTFASLVFLVFFMQSAAQRACGTQDYTNSRQTTATQAAERFILQQTHKLTSGTAGSASGKTTTTVIRIPVVVHVLYNTAAENISDAQIQSGIAAMNRDFRKRNRDTSNIPQIFKSAAADVQIEFHLATAAPDGRPTTGIVRKQTSVTAWNLDDKIKSSAHGGDDAWNSTHYLNIWLGNTRRLLGYATLPGGDEKLDGLVINLTAFGTVNTRSPYHLGRTAVHEAGHWLGLHHIWGDASCGDDLVDDTPQQSGYTSGCPNTFRSSCTNDGDMYMNYMDFTNDACMSLFTHGQKDRMRALFASGGPRAGLLNSKGLDAPWMEALPVPVDSVAPTPFLKLYPNPAASEVVLQFSAASGHRTGGTLYLMNASGALVEKIQVTSATQKIKLQKLHAGVYYLQGVVEGRKVQQKIVKL